MIIAVSDIVCGQSSSSDNYGHGHFYNDKDSSIKLVRIKLHCWTRYEGRIIVSNELKRMFGLYNVHLYTCGKYIVSLYRDGDITLNNVDISRISMRLMNKIRANFAFRVCLGMRSNTENSIIIRDDEPYSIIEKFPTEASYCRDHTSIISNDVHERWFNQDEVINYVHYFPLWIDYNTEDKLRILQSMNHDIFRLMNHYRCGYLHPYIIRNIKQGLLFN